MAEAAASEGVRGPGRSARVMLVAAVLATDYLDFFKYKAEGFAAPGSLDDRLLGHAVAPEQYRMGIYLVAHWMVTHLHIAPTMAFASLDGVAGLIAVLLVFGVFERTAIYARACRTLQWFGAAAFVLVVVWWLGWLLWLQKPETLPAAAFVAAMLWLWERPTRDGETVTDGAPSRLRGWLTAVGLVSLTAVLATFRADTACLLNVGVLAYVLATRSPGLALGRAAATVTAALGALAAGGIELWLMRVVYPQANYGRVKMWQLRPNFIHGTRWPPFVLFLLPLLWMLARGVRRGFARDAAGRAFLAGAVVYAALWVTIGKVDEVRIFLPFALALAPLTVEMAMQRVEEQ
jgi:hypothetical protein